MSQQNVETVKRAWEQFLTTGDIPRDLIHDDVETHWNPDIPGTQIYHGPEGLAKALREWQESWEQTEYEFFEMTDAGDHVLVGFRESATGRGGGSRSRRSGFRSTRSETASSRCCGSSRVVPRPSKPLSS